MPTGSRETTARCRSEYPVDPSRRWSGRNRGRNHVALVVSTDVGEIHTIETVIDFNLQGPELIVAKALAIQQDRVRVGKIGCQHVVRPTQDVGSLAGSAPTLIVGSKQHGQPIAGCYQGVQPVSTLNGVSVGSFNFRAVVEISFPVFVTNANRTASKSSLTDVLKHRERPIGCSCRQGLRCFPRCCERACW